MILICLLWWRFRGVRAARVTAALRDKRGGLAEMDRYGGTCVIRGCVPKALVFASIFPLHSRKLQRMDGAAEGTESTGIFLKKLNAEVSRLEGIYRNLLKNSGVQTFDQHAKVVDAHTIELRVGNKLRLSISCSLLEANRTYRIYLELIM